MLKYRWNIHSTIHIILLNQDELKMSNHDVGYVLNDVLLKLNKEGFFKDKSKEDVANIIISQEFFCSELKPF